MQDWVMRRERSEPPELNLTLHLNFKLAVEVGVGGGALGGPKYNTMPQTCSER